MIIPKTRLKELRIHMGLTQKDVAMALGLKTTTYSKYERGVHKTPVKIIIRAANFYNTSVDYLVYRTDDIKPFPLNEISE